MAVINISDELFVDLWKRHEAGDQTEEDILRRLLQLDSRAKTIEIKKQEAPTEGDPSLSESLSLEGHWCASNSCPKHLLAAQQAAQAGIAEEEPRFSDSPLREAHWCSSTACTLV